MHVLKTASVLFRFILGLAILGGAIGVFGLMKATREAPEIKPEVFHPLLVRGMVLTPQTVYRTWFGYGTVRAMDKSDVAAEVSARVVYRPDHLEVGASVEAGDVLFELNKVDFEEAARSARENIASLEAQLSGLDIEEERLARQLELAEEEAAIARRDYERARDTISRGAGNEAELDARLAAVRRAERSASALRQQLDLIPTRRSDLRARIEAQRATLRQAEDAVRRATIRSPIAGVVQSVELEEGEWAQAGRVVARIVSLARVEVPLRIPLGAARDVAVGDSVEIRFRAEDEYSVPGRVSRIAPEADAQTRSLTVFVEVEQDPAGTGVLRPGQFVAGTVRSSSPSRQIVVPRRCVRNDRIMIAAETDNPEAAAWPVARRIAESLARGAARSAHGSLAGPDIASRLVSSLSEAAKVEVGPSAKSLAEVVAEPTGRWMGTVGVELVEDQFVRVLTDHLAPEVATWLIDADLAQLPESLRAELERVERLSVVRAVSVESLFTIEGEFPELDPVERQWVVVRAVDGRELAGAVLLTSNLDQLIEGMLIDVTLQARGDEP